MKRDDSDRAQGAGLAPAAAAPPPAAEAAVPAGLRWTATEGGTYGADSTMTLCTKEAWGDIMSLFSGGLASDNEGAARRAQNHGDWIGAANAAATKAPALDAVAEEAPAAETMPEGGGDEFAIYEDTCVLPDAAAAARAAPAPAPAAAADAFDGLEIREDTVVIPPVGRTPAPARGVFPRARPSPLCRREPRSRPPIPRPRRPPPPEARARAPVVPPDDGGFDVYEDTVHLDPAAMGLGSQSSAPAGVAPTPRTFGEPSENGPDDRARDDEDDDENAAPRGFSAVDTFRPRSIADAAAAMAALRPLPVPLDLRSESDDAGERARAER